MDNWSAIFKVLGESAEQPNVIFVAAEFPFEHRMRALANTIRPWYDIESSLVSRPLSADEKCNIVARMGSDSRAFGLLCNQIWATQLQNRWLYETPAYQAYSESLKPKPPL